MSNGSIESVFENIEFDTPLSSFDEKYVSTEAGRGDFQFDNLFTGLNIAPTPLKFSGKAPETVYALFCGHRGCGKSTELNRFKSKVDRDQLFFTVQLDAASDLDINNIQYVDVFMALASKLFERLQETNITIDDIYKTNLEKWFFEKIVQEEKRREWDFNVESGAKAKATIPFFFDLFTKVRFAFKNATVHKDELRRKIQNTFSEFADSFNLLIEHVNEQLEKKVNRKKILFIVDGLDKLAGDEADTIFIKNINQLKQIRSNFIYVAPIDLLYAGGNHIHDDFNPTVVLPMIKTYSKDGEPFNQGFEVLQNLLYKRAHESLFEKGVARKIVAFSGGNPRHCLQLLKYTYANSIAENSQTFTLSAVDKAIRTFSRSFERFLTLEDYELLKKQDENPQDNAPSDHKRKLLHSLSLLQYNDFWWKSHPAVRELPAYKNQTDAS